MVMRSCVRCGATIPQDEGTYWAGRFYCLDDAAHDKAIARKVKGYVRQPQAGYCWGPSATVIQGPFAGLGRIRDSLRP